MWVRVPPATHMKRLITIFLIALISLSLTSTKNLKLINKGIYKSWYSEELKSPVKVVYSVYKYRDVDSISRKGMNFHSEPGIKTASSRDFTGNNYDKGHLAPAETFSQSDSSLFLTFSYVNCSVQHYQLNRGLWNKLEGMERKWSKDDSLIVTVRIIFDEHVKKLPTGTPIPKEFTKSIRFYFAKKTLKYKFPNTECKGDITNYQIK
jgi:DNA/RNA endonuclease G (NUC1)